MDSDVWRRLCFRAYDNMARDTPVTMDKVYDVLRAGAPRIVRPQEAGQYEVIIREVAAETGVPASDVDAILTWCGHDAAELLAATDPRDAAIARVRVLHKRVTGHYYNRPDVAVCEHCTSGGDPFHYPQDAEQWPCATIKALDGDTVAVDEPRPASPARVRR